MAAPVPGQTTGRTQTLRDCLMSQHGIIPGGGTIDSAKAYNGADVGYEYRIWPGTILGQITTTKLWVPCKRTAVTADGAATAQAIPVLNARNFRVGDVISVGGDTGKTIASINFTTNVITVSDTAFAFGNDEAVVVVDGSQTARLILNEEVVLYDRDNAVWRNMQFGEGIIAGLVDPNKCYGDVTTIRADTGNKLKVIFGDDAGQI